MRRPSPIAALMCGAAFAFPTAVLAQDAAAPVVLDSITLHSKRDVATDTATPVTAIDQREIDDRQAGTIAELIDSVPGVTLMNGNTPGGSGINIRGFGATGTYGTDQMVLIQVDGATQGSEELYRIGTQLYTDPALYKEVEVQRGTVGSFEYGSGVVGGLVRLRTKDASDFTGGRIGWAGRQTFEFTTNGDGITSSSILAWQPTEDLEFLAQYVRRKQDAQDDGAGDPIGAEPFDLPSVLVKGKYSFGAARDHSVTLSWNDTKMAERDVPYDQFAVSDSTFGRVDRDIDTRTAILEYEYDPDNPLIHVTANLSHADQQIDSSYIPGSSSMEGTPAWPMFAGSVRGLADADHRYKTTKLTVKNTAAFRTGAFSHDLRTGFEVVRKTRAEASSAPGGTDRRWAVFAVDDITAGGLTVSPALRYESQDLTRDGGANTASNPQTDFDNDAVMGGLSLRYAFGNGFAVFGSAAYTENLPILDDFNNAPYMKQPQKARTWELGASYDGRDLLGGGDRLALKANLFQTDVWDVTSYSGIGEVEMKGLEVETAYSMASGLYVDLNATWTEGDARATAGASEYWDYAPADRLRLTLGQHVTDELDLSWEAVAAARMDRVNAPTEEAAGHTIHNLRATYRPQTGVLEGAELRVGIENVFDKDYRPWLATRKAPGRNIKLTLAKSF
ncbi:TonB-dependent receptor domain-containing protein [Paracoccus sp. 22332]|uniref:TonB-dependent receptor domain-containing protein n=1 Tax=Paracoccus sp. 22332 TaxID=3453913 RepID=UPI003F83D764